MRSSRRRACEGFAFLWVLAAVAMLGLLTASAAEVITIQQKRDRELQLLSIGREVRVALRAFHDCAVCDSTTRYPTSLEELVMDRRNGANGRRYLRKIYSDPMMGSKDWGLVREGTEIVGIYSRSSERPVKLRGFDGEEMAFNNAVSYQSWVFLAQPLTSLH